MSNGRFPLDHPQHLVFVLVPLVSYLHALWNPVSSGCPSFAKSLQILHARVAHQLRPRLSSVPRIRRVHGYGLRSCLVLSFHPESHARGRRLMDFAQFGIFTRFSEAFKIEATIASLYILTCEQFSSVSFSFYFLFSFFFSLSTLALWVNIWSW